MFNLGETELIFEIVSQTVGIIGIIASILSFQCREHKKLMLFRTANESLFAVQYIMLGAYTGAAMNIFGSIRNVVFSKLVEKGKSTVAARAVFSVLFALFTVLTWAGPKSLLSGAAKILSTVAYGSSDTAFVRRVIFLTSSAWLVYNYSVGSYAGCVCEILTLASIAVGFVRLDLPKLMKKHA